MKKFSLFSLAGILILFLAVSITTSCKSKKEREAERIERMIEQATGEEVDVDSKDGKITIKTEEGDMDIDSEDGKITIKTEDGDVDLDLGSDDGEIVMKTEDGEVRTSESNTWPEEIPDNIPEFDYGDIVVVSANTMEGGHGWTMVMENVPESALNDYEKQLKEAGFEIQKVTMGKGGNLNGQKGKQYIAVMTGEGGASVSIQIED